MFTLFTNQQYKLNKCLHYLQISNIKKLLTTLPRMKNYLETTQ